MNRLTKLFMGDGFDPVLKGGNNADRQEGEKVVWFFDTEMHSGSCCTSLGMLQIDATTTHVYYYL